MNVKNKSNLVASALVLISLSSFNYARPTSTSKEKIIITTNHHVIPKAAIKENLRSESIIKKILPLKQNRKKEGDNEEKQEKQENPIRIVGWVLTIIGLGTLLFLSIYVGVIFLILGLALMVAGKPIVKKSANDKDADQLEDVVYLKNGGITRGMIMEQIPNVSLKIQTRDGNLFVYKMDEVIKIIKEPKFKNN